MESLLASLNRFNKSIEDAKPAYQDAMFIVGIAWIFLSDHIIVTITAILLILSSSFISTFREQIGCRIDKDHVVGNEIQTQFGSKLKELKIKRIGMMFKETLTFKNGKEFLFFMDKGVVQNDGNHAFVLAVAFEDGTIKQLANPSAFTFYREILIINIFIEDDKISVLGSSDIKCNYPQEYLARFAQALTSSSIQQLNQ